MIRSLFLRIGGSRLAGILLDDGFFLAYLTIMLGAGVWGRSTSGFIGVGMIPLKQAGYFDLSVAASLVTCISELAD